MTESIHAPEDYVDRVAAAFDSAAASLLPEPGEPDTDDPAEDHEDGL
ncbi:MAG TPA: hypothetical protein VNV66_20790 [Pilimelia sp.]|nr:hypothetical protein [Pilimelia sp.]